LKRALIATATAATLLLAVPAQAGIPPSGDDDNDYEGRAEESQNTYFGFDKAGNKVSGITAYLHYECQENSGGQALQETQGSLRVRNGKFAGKTTRSFASTKHGPPDTVVTYKTTGKLLPGGKAKGTIDAEIDFPQTMRRGNGTNTCFSGKLNWKAKSGADLDAPIRR
jgi:hypothetical protein